MLVGSSPLAETRYGILLLGTVDTPLVKCRLRGAVPVVPRTNRRAIRARGKANAASSRETCRGSRWR
jgi:hypothetical protein